MKTLLTILFIGGATLASGQLKLPPQNGQVQFEAVDSVVHRVNIILNDTTFTRDTISIDTFRHYRTFYFTPNGDKLPLPFEALIPYPKPPIEE